MPNVSVLSTCALASAWVSTVAVSSAAPNEWTTHGRLFLSPSASSLEILAFNRNIFGPFQYKNGCGRTNTLGQMDLDIYTRIARLLNCPPSRLGSSFNLDSIHSSIIITRVPHNNLLFDCLLFANDRSGDVVDGRRRQMSIVLRWKIHNNRK